MSWWRSGMAVARGAVTTLTLQVITTVLAILGIRLLGGSAASVGIALSSPLARAIDLACDAASMALGGWMSARRTDRFPVVHALAAGVVVLAVTIVLDTSGPRPNSPIGRWHAVAGWVLLVPTAAAGGAIASLLTGRSRSLSLGEEPS
jgi:hypothetical protein